MKVFPYLDLYYMYKIFVKYFKILAYKGIFQIILTANYFLNKQCYYRQLILSGKSTMNQEHHHNPLERLM